MLTNLSVRGLLSGLVVGGLLLVVGVARSDEPKAGDNSFRQDAIKKLEKTLTGAKLTGKFTVEGKEDANPKSESYTITSARKLPEGDLWMLKTRIQYGNTDKTLPIPLEIEWAGDTPVITMTNFAIPDLGTFTCRVLIYENRYAGTWQHDKVGGLLFGKIERADTEEGK
jgi:hypothetical protein